MSEKKKILVCLVSDQHVPNLLSIHHERPDHLVLLVTAKMEERRTAEHLLEALRLGGQDYAARHEIRAVGQEDSLASTRGALAAAFAAHPGAEWVVNVTGATKPMSIAAFDFFQERGRRIYINLRQPERLLDLDHDDRVESCTYRPGLREFLAGYGFSVSKSEEKFKAGAARARELFACARGLAAMEGTGKLLQGLDRVEWKSLREGGGTITPAQTLHLPAPVRRLLAEAPLGLREEAGGVAGTVDRHAADFLTGGWLESFFAELLRKHEEPLGVTDVRLGVPVQSGQVPNDLDVAFMRDHGLYWIECKTGSQEHDEGGDILYKIETVTRQVRALHAGHILATTSDNVLKDGKVKPGLRSRAELYKGRIVPRAEIRELAAHAEDADVVRRILFGEPVRT